MHVIYKYPLKPGNNKILTHEGSVLSVGFQKYQLFVWVLVKTNSDEVARNFLALMTGEELKTSVTAFIGTAMTADESFVLHVFETP